MVTLENDFFRANVIVSEGPKRRNTLIALMVNALAVIRCWVRPCSWVSTIVVSGFFFLFNYTTFLKYRRVFLREHCVPHRAEEKKKTTNNTNVSAEAPKIGFMSPFLIIYYYIGDNL